MVLAERKVMASMQRRKGPIVVGILVLLQPLADGLKLWPPVRILWTDGPFNPPFNLELPDRDHGANRTRRSNQTLHTLCSRLVRTLASSRSSGPPLQSYPLNVTSILHSISSYQDRDQIHGANRKT
jgi:hypothetical protein